MKNLSILIIAMLAICLEANAADNYKVGDTLYVWAPSGLNVRMGPSTNFGKMGKLEIGDYVIVKAITEKKYITNALPGYEDPYGDADGKENHPYQLRGTWIEVDSEKFYGYLVDIYLLKMPYPKQEDFEKVKVDTLMKGDYYFETVRSFPNGYEVKNYSGESGYYEEHILPNFTIEEGYVFINALYALEKLDADNSPIWYTGGTYTDELFLSDLDGMCTISLTLNNGILIIGHGCEGC